LTDLVARREHLERQIKPIDRAENGFNTLKGVGLLLWGNDKSGRINTLTLLDLLFVRNDA
jgi:hypothetical protein